MNYLLYNNLIQEDSAAFTIHHLSNSLLRKSHKSQPRTRTKSGHLFGKGTFVMNYQGMDPLKHFEFMFKAHTQATGRVRTPIHDIRPMSYSDVIPLDTHYEIEREISITMGEHDYNKFIDSYGKYLELIYGLENDSVAQDMFNKLLMYIALKR